MDLILIWNTTSGSSPPYSEVQLAYFPSCDKPHSPSRHPLWAEGSGSRQRRLGKWLGSDFPRNQPLSVGQRKRRLLFEITARLIVCRAIKRKRLRVHAFWYYENNCSGISQYVHYANWHSKWWTSLSCQEPFCPRAGGCSVSLYYHRWSNISAALGNNQASNGHTISDGYYNAYELDEEVFQPLGTEMRLHAPTVRLQLSAKKRLVLNSMKLAVWTKQLLYMN